MLCRSKIFIVNCKLKISGLSALECLQGIYGTLFAQKQVNIYCLLELIYNQKQRMSVYVCDTKTTTCIRSL